MPKKLLILMRGVPGSGKSYLARRLAGRLGAKLYSNDILLTARDDYIWTRSLCDEAHEICQQLVELAMLRNERIIVVDNCHIKVRFARPYVNLGKKYGYDIEVREPETAWRHDLDGLLAHGTHGLPREQVEDMLNNWMNMPLTTFKEILELYDPNGEEM